MTVRTAATIVGVYLVICIWRNKAKESSAYHSYPMETSSEGFPELIVSLVGAELKPFIPLHTKA